MCTEWSMEESATGSRYRNTAIRVAQPGSWQSNRTIFLLELGKTPVSGYTPKRGLHRLASRHRTGSKRNSSKRLSIIMMYWPIQYQVPYKNIARGYLRLGLPDPTTERGRSPSSDWQVLKDGSLWCGRYRLRLNPLLCNLRPSDLQGTGTGEPPPASRIAKHCPTTVPVARTANNHIPS